MDDEKRYWVAHVRGANFERLRAKGFTTYYPSMDDYVFLPATAENQKLLNKQTDLGVAFLKQKDKHVTISQKEMLAMYLQTENLITTNTDVLVVVGYGSNLEGKVLEVSEDGLRLRVLLQGFNRQYDVWVDRLEVVEKPKEGFEPKPAEEE